MPATSGSPSFRAVPGEVFGRSPEGWLRTSYWSQACALLNIIANWQGEPRPLEPPACRTAARAAAGVSRSPALLLRTLDWKRDLFTEPASSPEERPARFGVICRLELGRARREPVRRSILLESRIALVPVLHPNRWEDTMAGPNEHLQCEREEAEASDSEPVSFRLTEDMLQERHALDAEDRATVVARVTEIVATLEEEGRAATPEEQAELARYAPADATAPREGRAEELAGFIAAIEEATETKVENVVVMDDPDVVGADTGSGRNVTLTVSDELGANVARALYPEATVKQGRTERLPIIPDQLADAVVVNARDTGEAVWAFGEANAPVMAAQIERAISGVKPGGIVVAEAPISLSDRNPSIRSAITLRAEFVDMFRAREPDGSWRDIIVFRRLKPGEVAEPTAWTTTGGSPFMFRLREPDGSWRDVVTLRLFEHTDREVEEGKFRPITFTNAYLEENPAAVGVEDGDFDAFIEEAHAAQSRAVVDARDGSGRTPLHIAAYFFCTDPSIAVSLIESGADVNARDHYGRTPLHEAASCSTNDPSIGGILIQSGAVVDSRDQHGDTPLHNAAWRDRAAVMVRTLIDEGADVRARNWRGRTPLHEAAAKARNPDVVTLLVKAGANVNAQTSRGRTPLNLARTPTMQATLIKVGATRNKIKWLDNSTPLHRAAQSNAEAVPALIEAGVDVNVRDPYGETPLHFAARNEDPLAAKALVEAGADTNARAERGEAPLHRTVSPALASVLIEGGADVNAWNYGGETPLHLAARWCRDPALATLLLGAGADVHARDTVGATPIHYTAWSSRSVAVRAKLINAGADVQARDWYSRTLVHYAAANGDPAVVAQLLEMDLDVNGRDLEGNTPLHLAAKRDNPAVALSLISAGADKNARNRTGTKPLAGRGRSGRPESRLWKR